MSKNLALSDKDVSLIATQTGIDPDIIRAWHKDFIKECPNGTTGDENLNKIVDHIFACFDKDSSGYLDFNEFLVSYSATQIGETSKKLEMVFSFYDKDKNGKIDSTEFLRVINAVYDFKGINKKDYPPEKCVREVFKKMDIDGNHEITKDEFIKGCLENKSLTDFISPFDL